MSEKKPKRKREPTCCIVAHCHKAINMSSGRIGCQIKTRIEMCQDCAKELLLGKKMLHIELRP